MLSSVNIRPGSTRITTQTTRSRPRQAAHTLSPFQEEQGSRVQASLNTESPSPGLQPGVIIVSVEATARSSRSGEDIKNSTATLLPPQADGGKQEGRTGREAEDVGCILQPSHVSYPQSAQAREGSVAGHAPSDVPEFIHDDCGTSSHDESQWGPYDETENNPEDAEWAMVARREYHASAYTDYGECGVSAYGDTWNGEEYSDADMLQYMSDFYAAEAEPRYPDTSQLDWGPQRQRARASSSRTTRSARSSRASHASSSTPRVALSATLGGLLNPIPGNGEKFVRPSARRM
jgi:hypothetical protein